MANKWKDIPMKSPFKTDEQMSDAYNRLRKEMQDARDARDLGLA